MSWDDDFDDEYDQNEFDVDEPDETFSVPCSACKKEVYEDCEQCPHCGEYIVRSTNPLTGKPNWYIWLAVFGIIAVIFSMLLLF